MSIQGSKYFWKLPTSSHEQVAKIATEHTLSFPIAQTLLTRGFIEPKQIYNYLFCPQEAVADAALLKDAQKAVDRIMRAIKDQEKILISGDYDVDGITSSAMMMRCLLPLGAQVNFFLPHRVRDGYGLSVNAIEQAARSGYKVVITVDNGISAHKAAQVAHERGIALIITDHHKPQSSLPIAYAIVNPNQHDCLYPNKGLAGVGVTFKVLSLLYAQMHMQLPAKVYELLLLGTVADVVPLVTENRFWVRYGLRHAHTTESLSLKKLKQNAQFQGSRLTSLDVGFLLAPQINALGRLEDPRDGVKFLIGDSVEDIERIGSLLADLNQRRKAIEKSVVDDIVGKINRKEIDITCENLILAIGSTWTPGVIGLAASRLVGAYGKPAIVLHSTEHGVAKGSCRSIVAFDMFAALDSAKHLLEQFGGHAQAAGLAIKMENIPLFKKHMEELIAAQLTPADFRQTLTIDGIARLSDFNRLFTKQLELLEPFGSGNANPSFVIHNVTLTKKPQLLKNLHVKCHFFDDGVVKPTMFFNRPELFERLNALEQSCSIAAQVRENHWEGKTSIELVGLDIAI